MWLAFALLALVAGPGGPAAADDESETVWLRCQPAGGGQDGASALRLVCTVARPPGARAAELVDPFAGPPAALSLGHQAELLDPFELWDPFEAP